MIGKKKIEEFGRVSTLNDGTILPIAYYNPITDNFVTRGISFLDLVESLPIPTPPVSTGDILYGNVYFVDRINGNNTTGQIGNFNKPYASISIAITAAVAAGFNSSNRALIWIRSGLHNTNINLADGIDMYWDTNTVCTGELRDNGLAVNVNIYGHCIFKGTRALFNQGNSTINIQFDYADVVAAFVIASPSIESFLTFTGNYIKSRANGSGYANSFRGKANVTMKLRDYGACIHTFFDFRNSYSGKFRAYIPEVKIELGDLYGPDFKNGMFIRSCTNADIEIYTNWVNLSPEYTSMYGICVIGSAIASKITIKGYIIGLDSIPIYFTPANTSTTMIFEGDISTTQSAVIVNSPGNLKIRNSNIKQTTETVQHVFLISSPTTAFLQCQNVTIISESTTNSIFYSPNDNSDLYTISTYAYKTSGFGSFASADGGVLWKINLTNCMSNVDINAATILNEISTSVMSFEANTAFKLLN